MNELTIVIPTYNRENKLLFTLQSILSQDIKCISKIIVIDNNSNYDINRLIKTLQNDKIELIKNSFNTGMIGNLTNSFLHCKTKWVWLLSDDDIISNNSIALIENWINLSANVSSIRFTDIHNENHETRPFVDINDLESFIDYYQNFGHKGELMFMSNVIYNIELLNKYFRYSYTFSYTYVPHLVLSLFSLKGGNTIRIIDDKIVTYKDADDKSNWDPLEVYLGISTLSHLPLMLNKFNQKRFLNLFTCMNYRQLFGVVLKDYTEYNVFRYSLIYKNLWCNCYSFKDRVKILIRIEILKYKWLIQTSYFQRKVQ